MDRGELTTRRLRMIRSLAAAAAAGSLLLGSPATADAAAGACGAGTRETLAQTADGYAVPVCVSDAYSSDPASVAALGGILGGLVHGSELGLLRIWVETPADVATECGGPDALACYSVNQMVLPGELPAGSPPLGYLVAHEYGHHLLEHRRNDPWPANAWGTKRWATALGVCPATRRHELFQGYASMPCEAFAESFAMLQYPMLHMPWSYVDMLAPDDATESAMRADILHPWTGPTSHRYTGRLARDGTRRLRLSFPFDGTAALTASGAVRVRLALLSKGEVVAQARPGRSGTKLKFTICGSRRLRVRITAVRGSGAYALTVARP